MLSKRSTACLTLLSGKEWSHPSERSWPPGAKAQTTASSWHSQTHVTSPDPRVRSHRPMPIKGSESGEKEAAESCGRGRRREFLLAETAATPGWFADARGCGLSRTFTQRTHGAHTPLIYSLRWRHTCEHITNLFLWWIEGNHWVESD